MENRAQASSSNAKGNVHGEGDGGNTSGKQAPQSRQMIRSAETTPDEQELFLKVLENLKRVVAKTDSAHASITKTPTVSITASDNIKKAIGNIGGVPQKDSVASPTIDSEEPGSSKVTVSEKTKSLILQKLAGGGYVIDIDKDEVIKSVTEGSQLKVSVIGFENLTHGVIGKDLTSIKKEDMLSPHKQHAINMPLVKTTARLIAPATPSVQLFTCNFCDYYTENKNYLKQHIDLVHNSDRPFKCPYCDYAGKRSHSLREHMIVHSDERPYQCKSCNATFRKKGHLTNHIKLHNSKRLVKCPICKALVYDTGENGLDAHLKNDHDTERLYGCDLCDHVAANEPNILKHLNDKHKSKLSLNRCDKCPFETANTVDFNAHKTAHNISATQVQIGKSMSQVVGVAALPTSLHEVGPSNTSVHLTTKDTMSGSRPAVIKPVWIKCSECGFTAQDSEIIKKHMLEHLKMTELPDLPVSSSSNERPTKTSIRKVPNLQASLTSSSAHSNEPKVAAQASTNAPMLVPVTSIDNLFPHHAGKLDIRSPILVPVTDVNVLKSLQSTASSPLKIVKVTESLASPSASSSSVATKSISSSQSLSQSASPVTTKQHPPQPKPSVVAQTSSSVVFSNLLNSLKSSGSQSVMSTASSTSQTSSSTGPIIHLQPHEMEQLLKNPSLRVVPVTTQQQQQQAATASPAKTSTSSTKSLLSGAAGTTSSSSSMSSKHSTIVSMLQGQSTSPVAASPKTVPSSASSTVMYVTQIPVPRMVDTNIMPKLPPDIVQLKSPFTDSDKDELVEDHDSKAAEPPIVHTDDSEEQKLASLRQSLVKVQKLIEEQEKLSRQVGGQSQIKMDSQGIPNQKKQVVYYVTPVEKQNNSKNVANAGFTHDSSAGRFRCTLCGYTCEYQRTIKAHIWKHSGNKDIDYPMFQNGPLSIYEDALVLKNEEKEIMPSDAQLTPISLPTVPSSQEIQLIQLEASEKETDTSAVHTSTSQMPNFIVYEQTKISPVAPALAQLIAARAMVGLKETDNGTSEDGGKAEQVTEMDNSVDKRTADEAHTAEQLNDSELFIDEEVHNTVTQPHGRNIEGKKMNVVVETVESVASSYAGYTGMRSQQGSPRITTAPRSPDSGVSEMTSSSKAGEDSSSNSLTLPLPNFEYLSEDSRVAEIGSRLKRVRNVVGGELDESEIKKTKMSTSHEDSAVTLLSLLKKGPNYNPACPPKEEISQDVEQTEYSNSPSPGNEDSNSHGESEIIGGSKPKSGISTSLLAVIEQLRERSKCDTDEEKPLLNPGASKKAAKRRSRKSSMEDNTPATGILNVEEFMFDGEIKFRCKLCHYTNDSTVLLKQHMRLHKPKQEFECSLCDLIAESSEALQDHMIQHCKVRTYQCKLCNLHFNYKSQLRAHMRMHNDQDILMCDFCDFETRSSSALKAHTRSHLTKPPYKCEFCKEEFITSFNLRQHKKEGCYTSVVSDKTGSFKCNECDYMSIGRRDMKNHQKCHIGSSSVMPLKQCPYCSHAALTAEQINQHLSDTHGDLKPLKCELCGFVAVSIRSLKSHMKRHVNDQRFVAQPLEQYKCNLCGYVCHHLPSLKSHMWRHAADQQYSYEFTNDVINAAIDFDSHTDAGDTTKEHVEKFRNFIYKKMKVKGLENVCNGDENTVVSCWVDFRCCQCGFETINKAELNMHMAAHSDVIKWTLKVPYSGDDNSSSAKQDDKDLADDNKE